MVENKYDDKQPVCRGMSLLCVAEDQPGGEVNLNDKCK